MSIYIITHYFLVNKPKMFVIFNKKSRILLFKQNICEEICLAFEKVFAK